MIVRKSRQDTTDIPAELGKDTPRSTVEKMGNGRIAVRLIIGGKAYRYEGDESEMRRLGRLIADAGETVTDSLKSGVSLERCPACGGSMEREGRLGRYRYSCTECLAFWEFGSLSVASDGKTRADDEWNAFSRKCRGQKD